MTDTLLQTPQSLREEAERCFRHAETLRNEKDRETVIEYARELLVRAERMEAALGQSRT
jgi:hypothetical protein